MQVFKLHETHEKHEEEPVISKAYYNFLNSKVNSKVPILQFFNS